MTALGNRTRWVPVALGCLLVALAWLVAPETLARWFEHPRRAGAAEAALLSARWARIGWTIAGLVLAAMPWALRDRRVALAAPGPVDRRGLWLAMLLAVALRFSASTQSLWYDEIASLGTYVAHGPGVIVANAFTTANHPLQSLLSWCCLPLGVEPWVRLPSMLTGALAVLGGWCIGRALRDGTRLASAMAFALAVLPAAVNAGSEARGYGLMIACSALSTGLLLMAMRHGGTWRWIACAITLALGVWAHFVTAMVGVGHALVALWMLRSRGERALAAGMLATVACAALLSLALWSPALPDLVRTRSQFGAHRGDEPSLAGPQGLLLLWQLVGMTPLPMRASAVDVTRALLFAIPPACLMLAGASAALADRRLRRGLALAGVGLPTAIVLASIAQSWLYARFLLFAVPASALLLCMGAERLARRPAIAITLLALTLPIYLTCDVGLGPRQPIREAVAQVAETRSTAERVLGIGIADDVVQWYAMALEVPIESTGVGGEQLPGPLARTDARWIVALYPRHRHADASEQALADLGFQRDPPQGLVGWLDAGEGTVEIWRRERRKP